MAQADAAVAGLTRDDLNDIPVAGLAEALEGWSSKGELWAGLAAVPAERDWTWRDSERRAMRVLLAELVPALTRWPAMELTWVEALPAVTHRTREVAAHLGAGVSWPQTRLHGWPPREFVCRPKSRVADQLLVTTLRWTIERLADVRASATAVAPDVDLLVRTQLDVAEGLLDVEPVADAPPVPPDAADFAHIVAEGPPWSMLAAVAKVFLSIDESSVLELARRLVAPTEERWRLFHLGVFGEVLLALRAEGCRLRSLRPLSATSIGPSFEVWDSQGIRWDLWFEASGVWRWYGTEDPYLQAAAGVPGAGSPLGTDIALLREGERALVLECKYSKNPAVVARDGYRAVLAYAAEMRTALVDDTLAVAVGPDGTVRETGWTRTSVGPAVIAPASGVRELLRRFLS